MIRTSLLVGVATASWLAVPAVLADAPDRAAEGRAITASFGTELRAALQAAMTEGGPLAAIQVCNEQAPRMAATATEASGATVRRTSMRLRNPANHPDAHESAALAELAIALAAAGPDSPPPERLDTLEDGRVRYMSAIVMQPPCLACHGETLAAPVAAAIDARYPEDEARGFRLGELRGAFSITWPAD